MATELKVQHNHRLAANLVALLQSSRQATNIHITQTHGPVQNPFTPPTTRTVAITVVVVVVVAPASSNIWQPFENYSSSGCGGGFS